MSIEACLPADNTQAVDKMHSIFKVKIFAAQNVGNS